MSFEINPLDFSLGFFALSTYRGLVVRQRTARERVKRFAERVAPVAQTTHPTQAGLARVLNSLVVPPFLRRGILVFICAVAQRIDADRMEQLEVTMCDFKFKRNAKYRG